MLKASDISATPLLEQSGHSYKIFLDMELVCIADTVLYLGTCGI